MFKILLLITSLLLEVLGLLSLTKYQHEKFMWLTVIFIHAIACFFFMIAGWFLLPGNYRNSPRKVGSFLFLFLFSFFLPLFGVLGVSLSLLIALHLPRKQSDVTWKECDELPLPQSPGEIGENMFGAGALTEILTRNEDPERRLLAVSAVHYFPRNQTVPLLQLALKDLSDDVRLLAYSSLESIEAEINIAIGACKKQFKKNETATKAAEIGHQYWELCYLGIAEGSLRNHYLQEAENFLSRSNDIERSASNHLLFGRVLLAQKKCVQAKKHFELALDAGLISSQVAPYLAECAFRAKEYQKVRELIKRFPVQQGNSLSQIREYWS